MALYCDVGTFALNAATGSQTISFTPNGGVSYTPLLIEIITVNVTGDGNSVGGAAYKFGYGAGVPGGSQFALYNNGQDNISSGGFHSRHDDTKILTTVTNAGAVFTAAALTGASTDQFTINVTTANASQRRFHFRVWGGSDLSNVAIIKGQIPVSTGVDATFSGIGFTPTFARIIGVGLSGAPSQGTAPQMSLGATDGVNTYILTNRAAPHGSGNSLRQCTAGAIASVPIYRFEDSTNLDSALFSSFASGVCNLNWTDNDTPGASVYGIFMAGPSVYIGNATLNTTTGTQTLTGMTNNGAVGTPFTPKTIAIASVGSTGSTQTTNARPSFGYGTGNGTGNTGRAAIWAGETSGASPTITDNVNESDHILIVAREGTPTVDCIVDLDSFGSGSAQLDVETSDAAAYYLAFEAFGDIATGPTVGAQAGAAGMLAAFHNQEEAA